MEPDGCAHVRDDGILVTLGPVEGTGDRVQVGVNGFVAWVAVRVELWGAGGGAGEQRLVSSSTVNSGTASSAQVKTPEVVLASAPCFLSTRAFVTIRWSDNRLSSVSFDTPAGYFNPDAHC